MNKNDFTSSFLIWMLSFLFVQLARTSSWTARKRVDILVLFLIFSKRPLNFSPLRMMLALGFSQKPLSGWRSSILSLVCWEVVCSFVCLIQNGCWILSKAFLAFLVNVDLHLVNNKISVSRCQVHCLFYKILYVWVCMCMCV